MPATRTQPVLPAWLTLWFPPLLLLVIFPIRIADHAFYRQWIEGELGLIELATPVVAVIAAVIGCLLLARVRQLQMRQVTAWVAIVAAACIYLAGEELSWGQHLVGWSTPDYIGSINDQNETNLHNVSSWFDQKPRLLLEIWVLVGGVILPLREWRRGSGYRREEFRYWFWPTVDCLPTAVLAIAIRIPPRVKDIVGAESIPYEIRYSEPQEYYFALFLLIYLASMYARLDRRPATAA